MAMLLPMQVLAELGRVRMERRKAAWSGGTGSPARRRSNYVLLHRPGGMPCRHRRNDRLQEASSSATACGATSSSRRPRKAEQLIEEQGLEVVRLSFPDQHGILRGKTVMAADAARAMRNGCTITTTLLAKDTSHRSVFPVFTAGGGFGMPEMEGGADFLMIADPTTLPRAAVGAEDRLGAVRHLFPERRAGAVLDPASLRRCCASSPTPASIIMAGLEVEFHVFKLENPRLDPADATWPGEAPAGELLSPGYQYLTETRFDQIEPILESVRRDVVALGLPLRSVEIELGPSQCEFTFHPQVGLAPADTMMLFRSAVKQICRRQGYHASFMCRPKLPNVMSSGWHLHQSLRDRRGGANAFMPRSEAHAVAARRAISSAGCSRMRALRRPSPRRRSTATSATAPMRWRPTA